MGLDMYLTSENYLSEHREEQKALSSEIGKLVGLPMGRVRSVVADVAYWRKTNSVHKWFVDNIQGGNDDGGHYYVGRARLIELRDIAIKVLDAHTEEVAMELLPPQEGFFFGSTIVNDWYWDDIKDTVKQLNEILEKFTEDSEWDFKYHASW